MKFSIGQRVTCVDSSPPFHCSREQMPHQLVLGGIYTIRFYDETEGVLLEEVKNPPRQFSEFFGEARWDYNRFRPLIGAKKSVRFTTGADLQSDKWDNRRPIEVHTFDEAAHQEILQYLRGFY